MSDVPFNRELRERNLSDTWTKIYHITPYQIPVVNKTGIKVTGGLSVTVMVSFIPHWFISCYDFKWRDATLCSIWKAMAAGVSKQHVFPTVYQITASKLYHVDEYAWEIPPLVKHAVTPLTPSVNLKRICSRWAFRHILRILSLLYILWCMQSSLYHPYIFPTFIHEWLQSLFVCCSIWIGGKHILEASFSATIFRHWCLFPGGILQFLYNLNHLRFPFVVDMRPNI